jgi:putative sterol carrier protein
VSDSTDPTDEFFRELATRGYEPLLGRVSGTIRFDLADGDRVEHWYVTVKKGDVTVSHKNVKADAVLGGEKELFGRIATGRENGMAALLRGAIVPQGDVTLMLYFGRVFPGPPSPPDAPAARSERRAR